MSKFLVKTSFEVKALWTLGILSIMLQVPKKHLRTALKIIQNPKLKAEILEKGRLVKRTFVYGFREFFIVKNGKERQILAPHPDVQLVFKGIKIWLESLDVSHSNAFGFVKKKNPKKALESLLSGKHFIGFDIADAFPSITGEMIKAALCRRDIHEAVADVLVYLITYDYDNQRRLPQGSTCSPILLNLVYRPMCDEIETFCRQHGIIWNVYADDFNIAGQNIPPELMTELLAIPVKYGFLLKERKTRNNLGKTIPHVLGLTIVDGKIHINHKTKNRVRRVIYAAMNHNSYSVRQVDGLVGYIRHIYGEEPNWPGSIYRLYQQYQERRFR